MSTFVTKQNIPSPNQFGSGNIYNCTIAITEITENLDKKLINEIEVTFASIIWKKLLTL